MEKIFKQAEFDKIKLVPNCDDILNEIDEFIKESNETELDLFHFHYSGHGEISANIELNAWNYSKRFEGDTAYTDYQATNDYVGGDCMVGAKGMLCSVEMAKR